MTDSPETSTIDRRRVLKATGATAVGLTAFSGVAAAEERTDGPVFCGCSQVCMCGEGDADVVVASEQSDGTYSYERVTRTCNFCHEVEDAKIIAVEHDDTTYCNPNENCAGDALAECDVTCDEDGEAGGPCGKPPCEHPGRGNGRKSGRGNERDGGRGNGHNDDQRGSGR